MKQCESIEQTQLSKVQTVLESYIQLYEECSEFFAELDIYQSFAIVSCSGFYTKPIMVDMNAPRQDKFISIKQGRHPCVELQTLQNSYIPNDVSLQPDKSRFVIVTGPNSGGKSTYIRMIAVLQIMAQIGCFVPCEYAHLPVVDKILCRVGANDIQLRGYSTFMTEMIEMTTILNVKYNPNLKSL